MLQFGYQARRPGGVARKQGNRREREAAESPAFPSARKTPASGGCERESPNSVRRVRPLQRIPLQEGREPHKLRQFRWHRGRVFRPDRIGEEGCFFMSNPEKPKCIPQGGTLKIKAGKERELCVRFFAVRPKRSTIKPCWKVFSAPYRAGRT